MPPDRVPDPVASPPPPPPVPVPVPQPAGRPAWAVVLAGGAGSRLGLVDKPALRFGDVSLLDIALASVAPARTVVVGPHRDLPAEVLQCREDPPGGGPAAAVATGIDFLTSRLASVGPDDLVAVLASDLPGIDSTSIDQLTSAVTGGGLTGAVLLDPAGRSQYLASVWRLADLLGRCRSRPSWDGGRLSELVAPLIGALVPVGRRASADLDTTADLLDWGVRLPPS